MNNYKIYSIDATQASSNSVFQTIVGNYRPLQIIVDLKSVSGFVSAPTISIGTNSPNYDNFLNPTILTISTLGCQIIQLSGLFPDTISTEHIYLKVSTPASALNYTIDVAIIGLYDE